jgi:hypothetical protein
VLFPARAAAPSNSHISDSDLTSLAFEQLSPQMYTDRRLKFADRKIPAAAAWQPAGWF